MKCYRSVIWSNWEFIRYSISNYFDCTDLKPRLKISLYSTVSSSNSITPKLASIRGSNLNGDRGETVRGGNGK